MTNNLCFLRHSVCNPQNVLNSERGHRLLLQQRCRSGISRTPANTLAGEEKRHNISYPLRHTQTHTHLVEEEWNVGSGEGWNVTVQFLSIPGSDICLDRLSRGGAVLLCTV